MSVIRNVHDTFLHFLKDNLGSIPVRERRFNINDASEDTIQTNALNVKFQQRILDNVGRVVVLLDLAHDDELTGLDWENSISDLVRKTALIPILDYTNLSAVVPAGGSIYWPSKVVFRTVVADYYYHSTATLTLTFPGS